MSRTDRCLAVPLGATKNSPPTDGIPAVECAVGTDTAHQLDEYVPVDAFEVTAEWYTRIPATIATQIHLC